MNLGLIIEGEYDKPVILRLVKRICEQSNCPVDISKERIWFARSFGSINKRLVEIISQLQIAGSEAIVVVADNDRKPLNKRLNSLRSKTGGINIPVAIGITFFLFGSTIIKDGICLILSALIIPLSTLALGNSGIVLPSKVIGNTLQPNDSEKLLTVEANA